MAGCGDRTPDRTAAPAGESVTITLPEPTPPVVDTGTANAADGNTQSNENVVTDAKPAPMAEAPAETPARKEVKPSPKPEPAEDAVTPAPVEKSKAPTPPAQSASLPLPNAVIVRTIEKIGYPCGSIVSSARIEGASGSSDYRINCSSGASYRASNRSGRYRFSKAD
jgi:hypothetical protein